MIEPVKVESSNLEQVAYDAENNRALVWFKGGGVYAYNGVPKDVYEQLVAAESKGEFLNATLKPTYPATRVLYPESNPLLSGFPNQILAWLDWNFAYHAPNAMQAKVYEAIRGKAKEMAAVIMANCPADSARDQALNSLKIAVMQANQSVALNPAHYDPELRKKIQDAQAAAQAQANGQVAAPAAPEAPASNGSAQAPEETEYKTERPSKKKKH